MARLPMNICIALSGLLGASTLGLPVAAGATAQSRAETAQVPPRLVVGSKAAAASRGVKRPGTRPVRLGARRSPSSETPKEVEAANAAARVQPADSGFQNAIQRYAYSEGALFQIHAKPDQVTDIALQEGERLVGPGPVAAGDTVRWMIGDTVSGSGETTRVHILVKPIRPDIATNMVINTDRRTYYLELRANPRVYMASVSWHYPADALIAPRGTKEEPARTSAASDAVTIENLNFDYALSGDKPAWRPVRVFDDGQRTRVEFAPAVAQDEMPPLFVIGPQGQAELVNYRVSGRYLIVDRLFDRAELRLGAGRRQTRVTITNRARNRR